MSATIVVRDWARSCPVIYPDQVCMDLVSLFRQKTELECIAVCDEYRRPSGLVMKHRFFRMMGSHYGMSLFADKPISRYLGVEPFQAELDIHPQDLIDRALSRDEETFYDAVILTDKGKFAGILTVNDLLNVSRLMQRSAVSRQMSTIKHTEAMIENVHQSIEKVSETTLDTQACSDRIAEFTDQGRKELEQMLQLFNMWSETAVRQEQAILQLTERAREAEGIIRLIADLADQSNLLALNASIEAARTGQQGAGFGVVANEIRGLADQTKQSTAHITSLLKSMSEAVSGAASLVREGKQGADQGFVQVRQTEETFQQLWNSAAVNRTAATRLAEASYEAKNISNGIRKELQKLMGQMNNN